MQPLRRSLLTIALVLGAQAIGAGAFVWSGAYNIGADDPHWAPTRMAVDSLRERSIAARTDDLQIPDLDAHARIAAGAVNYSAMCTDCHLAPGMTDAEIRPGLYPMPPDLTRLGAEDARRTFWIVKHGIKMSAMPAWGKTHTDTQIWNMVAFIRKLPGMTPAQYQALGGKPPEEDEEHMHASAEHDHVAMDTPAASVEKLHVHARATAAEHRVPELTPAVAKPVEHRHVEAIVESHPEEMRPPTQPADAHAGTAGAGHAAPAQADAGHR